MNLILNTNLCTKYNLNVMFGMPLNLTDTYDCVAFQKNTPRTSAHTTDIFNSFKINKRIRCFVFALRLPNSTYDWVIYFYSFSACATLVYYIFVVYFVKLRSIKYAHCMSACMRANVYSVHCTGCYIKVLYLFTLFSLAVFFYFSEIYLHQLCW